MPALGKPTRPASAITLKSKRSVGASPSSPGVNSMGTWWSARFQWRLPHPPRPPWATSNFSPCWVISPRISSVSAFFTTVPSGTGTSRSLPFLPCMPRPAPAPPFSAKRWELKKTPTRESTSSSPTTMTFPPRPPSPPSGPPLGTNFSRRKLVEPFPPFPPRVYSKVESTNWRDFMGRRVSNGRVNVQSVICVHTFSPSERNFLSWPRKPFSFCFFFELHLGAE